MIVLSMSFDKKTSIKMSRKECETLFYACNKASKCAEFTDSEYELLAELADKIDECTKIERSYEHM